MFDSGSYKTGAGFKKNKRRLRFWMIVGGFFLLLALSIGIFYFILNSAWLKVKSIDAPDLPGVSRESILDSIKIQMMANRFQAWLGPENILFWELRKDPNFTQGLPALKNLRVKTDFWDRSVSISADERQLWSVVCDGMDSNCFGLDENGLVFSRAPSVFGSLILKINDPNNRAFILGQKLFSQSEWFSNFKQTIEILNRNGFRVISIKMGNFSLREWTARVIQGPEFYFSLNFIPENFDSVLKNLGGKLDFRKTAYVDFRVPNRIYYKPI